MVFLKKIASAALCAVMLVGCIVPQASAITSRAEWDEYWEEYVADGDKVYVSPGSDDSCMNVFFYSPEVGDSFVKVSPNRDMSGAITFNCVSEKNPQGDGSNRATLTGLSPDTDYYYRCYETESGYVSDVYTFTTEDGDGAFSAFYTSDIHIADADSPEQNLSARVYNFNTALEDASSRTELSVILSGGDQASSALREEYESLIAAPVLKQRPIALTIGNHDRKAINFKFFKNLPNENSIKYFTSSCMGNDYWFVRDGVLFLMLDTNNTSALDHRRFVKDAVESNPDTQWRVAIFHHDLYGGRIEHRESENKLLRLLITPILDEFKVDLALMGHSHYYTISNVMFDNRTVTPIAELDSVTNPAGTVYLVSGSINNPRVNDGEEPPLGENIGKSFLTTESTYTVLDFDSDSIEISSYITGADEAFETFDIVKTSRDGGHPQARQKWYAPCVRFLSYIVGVFNNFGNKYECYYE